MVVSPVKTIIRNKTHKQLISVVTSRLRVILEPAGKSGDCAKIPGDIFTYFETSQGANGFMDSVLSGSVEIEYVIDNVGSVKRTEHGANYNSSVKYVNKIKELNKPKTIEAVLDAASVAYEPERVVSNPVKTEPIAEPVKEEAKAVEPELVEEAVEKRTEETAAEPVKEEVKEPELKEAVENQTEESVAEAAPVETTESSVSEDKPKTKRTRKAKQIVLE